MVLLVAAAGMPWAMRAVAAPSPEAEAPARGKYIVFFGLDVFADDHGTILPVVGGADREVLVRGAGNEAIVVPRRDVMLSARLETKLSRGGVRIDALDGFPVHSPVSDPVADAQAQLIAMQNIEADRQEASEQALRRAEYAAAAAGTQAGMTDANAPNKGQVEALAAAANAEASAAMSGMASVYANPQFGGSLPGSAAKDGAFDGYEATFRISAPSFVSDAWGVVRFLGHDPGRSQSTLQVLQLFRVRELDARPRKIVVRQFGLPPGFTVDSYEVHVFVGDHELATNLSSKRVDLGLDEAHQFLVLVHRQRHGGATLPSQVAEELRPPWPRAGLAAEWANVTVKLDITAEGVVDEVVAGGAIARPLTVDLQEVIRGVRFLPALVNGRPSRSEGTFTLGELFRAPGQG